jgi:D-alanine-D-alanine ligase
MKGMRVAVIAGGLSSERDISLLSGANVLSGFKDLGWPCKGFDWVSEIKAPKDGAKGFGKTRLSALIPALKRWKTEVVFLALHGTYGEDGCIQGLLAMAGIPHTGSGILGSALAMDKPMSKRIFEREGIPTPAWSLAPLDARKAFKAPGVMVVKPADQGSAVGVSIVKTPEALRKAVRAVHQMGSRALVERYIAGRELTVAVLGDTALPVVEIVPKNKFYDWESKYAPGGSRHLCPAPIPADMARKAQVLALKAHQALGCSGYSRADLLVDSKGGLWMLEVNTLPGMTRVSLMPDAAKAAGITFESLLKAMVLESLKGKR